MPFIPDPAILTAFTLACIVLAITPGPDMVLFLSKTLGQGRKAGFAALLGALSGMVLHTLLAAFGLSALLASSAWAFGMLKIAGALYLAWLAYSALASGSSLTLTPEKQSGQNAAQTFLQGVSINMLNPKVVLFFVTFLPQFVSASDPDAGAKFLFLGFYLMALGFLTNSILIMLAETIAVRLRRSPRITRVIDWLFAGVFAAFAIRILLEPHKG